MMILDPRFKRNYVSDKKKYAWFLDQYKNPSETVHTFSEILGWFKKNNLDFVSSIPFNFNINKPLLEPKKISSKTEIFFQEMSQMFSLSQIDEGGFFIMIGRKK